MPDRFMRRCKYPGHNRKPIVSTWALLAVFAFGSHAWARVSATDRLLELEVFVNGRDIGMIGEFRERGGRLFATMGDLDSLGFRVSPAGSKGATRDLALSSLPGVTYRLEERTQTLFITAANRALKPTILQALGNSDANGVQVRSGLGAALNYDAVSTYLGGQTLAEAAVNGNIFSPWGLLRASGIATSGSE